MLVSECLDSAAHWWLWGRRAECLDSAETVPGRAGERLDTTNTQLGRTGAGAPECPPGFRPIEESFDEEERLRNNARFTAAITVRDAVPRDFELAVQRLETLGITRSDAACHIMRVGLEVHNQIMQSIEVTFQMSERRGDCT